MVPVFLEVKAMSAPGRRRFPSLIETVIAAKGDVAPSTAETIRTDAAVILEALTAEFSEAVILAALGNHGVAAESYKSTLVALSNMANSRRTERLAGVSVAGP
jgi:hypothetical protein